MSDTKSSEFNLPILFWYYQKMQFKWIIVNYGEIS